MNQSLTALLAALGLTVPAGVELTDEVATAALSADLNALKTQAPTEVVDLRRYVPVDTYNAVREQVVSLSADLGKTTLAQTLDKAEQDGRILKSERPYLESLGDQIGVTALSAQLATRRPIAALTRVQTETLTMPPTNREKIATVALSADRVTGRARAGDDPGGVPENQDRGRTIMPTPITPSQITALMTGFRKEFQNGLGMAPYHYQQVATTVASTSKSNTYGWLGQFSAFREWVGSRSIQQMKVYGYAINNKTYEGTVAITRDDFEDDNLGSYSPLFQEMGRAATAQPDELVHRLARR
nr:Mu-like prophage major head subunit gpT family protein [Sodalis glossinidius]